jgi:glycerophosphoryl diester phosphodiesterase
MLKPDPFYTERPLVIAHRGACDVAPENTLAAFRAALEADADGIELDVTRCASGEIVVIHDDTVDRTTNGSGRVDGFPLFALRELDAGSRFAPRFAGERIPLLEEVLDLIGTQMRINIEIKGARVWGDGIEEEIAEMVRRRKLGATMIFSSFSPAALRRAKRIAPELRCGLLCAPQQPLYLARAWARLIIPLDAWHPHQEMVNAASLRWAHDRGFRVNAWTVDDDAAMQRLIALGVDGIITNHPARLRSLLPR